MQVDRDPASRALDILASVGRTPLVQLRRAVPPPARILLKLEFLNPLSSVKDRVGLAMVEAAENEGRLGPGAHIVEPTSGNTGIALAFVCAAKGYRLSLTMPESMSLERRALLAALGAHVELTPARFGMQGALGRAVDIEARDPSAWLARQFDNPANPAIHEATTGPEILAQAGHVDVLVAGVGTGGTITGCARFLRRSFPNLHVVAVEPAESAVLSGGTVGPHRIQGIGAGFVPRNLDESLVDEVLTITSDEAELWARRMAREEGIVAGISSGANVAAAARLAARADLAGATIVTFACSAGERYLTSGLFNGSAETWGIPLRK